MGETLRGARAVLRRFDPEQHNWAGARIVIKEKIVLETFWKNREVYGTYVFVYRITARCFAELLRQRLVEHIERTAEGDIYQLSEKGNKRLRES